MSQTNCNFPSKANIPKLPQGNHNVQCVDETSVTPYYIRGGVIGVKSMTQCNSSPYTEPNQCVLIVNAC